MKTLATCMIASVLLTAAYSANARCDANETIIRFSHDVDTDKHPKGIAATELAMRVNRQLNGLACMRIYPFSSLIKKEDEITAVINGDVEMAAPDLARFAQYAGAFRVFEMPFIFRDLSAVQDFQRSSAGADLKQSMRSAGILGLTYWHGGMRQMAADRALSTPSNIDGLSIGTTHGGENARQLKAVGFKPFSTTADALTLAVTSGKVQAVEATWAELFRHQVYKVRKVVTPTNHGVDGYLLMTSSKFWDSLKPTTRDLLWTTLWALSEERNGVVIEQEQTNQERLLNVGAIVAPISDGQRGEWVLRFEPTWTDRIK